MYFCLYTGNLGTDLKAMWDLFYNGYTYEFQKLSESVGYLQVPLGLVCILEYMVGEIVILQTYFSKDYGL